MIRIQNVVKRFGALDALRGVTLDVDAGRVMALVGPNASGKSTLIKVLLGLVRPDSGAVEVCGVPAAPDGAYRAVIGYMPQLAKFPDNLTVRDVFALVGALRPGATRDEELVEAFRLPAISDRPVRTLSGGTRQKVSAALALLFSPKVAILDEPTAGLDPLSASILKDKIRALRDAGGTVLVSSHVSAELEGLCDDVTFLCDGEVGFTGSFDQLLTHAGAPRLEGAIATLVRSRRRA